MQGIGQIPRACIRSPGDASDTLLPSPSPRLGCDRREARAERRAGEAGEFCSVGFSITVSIQHLQHWCAKLILLTFSRKAWIWRSWSRTTRRPASNRATGAGPGQWVVLSVAGNQGHD